MKVELTFGDNEANMENRTLDISVDSRYPLQFSIINGNYKINSFEQKSNAKLQLKSITPTYNNNYYTGYEYNIYLYLKFPLNTFERNDEVVDLTFDEYNKATKSNNVEFTSLSKIEEKHEEDIKTNKTIKNIIIVIICAVIIKKLIIAIIQYMIKAKEREISFLRDEWEKIIIYETDIEIDYPKTYREERLPGIKNIIFQKYKDELEQIITEMQKTLVIQKKFRILKQKAVQIMEVAKIEFKDLEESERPIREQYRQLEILKQQELQRIEGKLSYIDTLHNGYEFEEYIANLLKNLGYTNVEVTSGSGDNGADVLAQKNGITYAIQCKWSLYGNNNIGNKAVQEIFSGKTFYNKDRRNSCNK